MPRRRMPPCRDVLRRERWRAERAIRREVVRLAPPAGKRRMQSLRGTSAELRSRSPARRPRPAPRARGRTRRARRTPDQRARGSSDCSRRAGLSRTRVGPLRASPRRRRSRPGRWTRGTEQQQQPLIRGAWSLRFRSSRKVRRRRTASAPEPRPGVRPRAPSRGPGSAGIPAGRTWSEDSASPKHRPTGRKLAWRRAPDFDARRPLDYSLVVANFRLSISTLASGSTTSSLGSKGVRMVKVCSSPAARISVARVSS